MLPPAEADRDTIKRAIELRTALLIKPIIIFYTLGGCPNGQKPRYPLDKFIEIESFDITSKKRSF
jgi:hypothetical protein